MKQTLAQVSASLCVDLIGEDKIFTQVSINTRTMKAGDLFVAIKGENFDGHQYIEQAEKKGACALVVEQCCSSVLPQIIVENTRTALGDIAALWSSAFSLPIVAITGSCGKTTVKEMTTAIFQQTYKTNEVLSTRGNLNNEIGVPLTLLRLKKEHKVAVIELGANHSGEIKYLVDMVQPDVAAITNVTHAHIEGFGSIEGIAKAKAEIYTGLESDGTAVINADDEFADYWQAFCQQQPSENGKIKQLTFGLLHANTSSSNTSASDSKQQADVSADYKKLPDGFELKLKTPTGEKIVHLKQFGLHNIYNALAATAVTLASGCSLDEIKSGLESFTNASGRLEKKQGLHGAMIFDDTYNANPGSVIAGIDAIKQVESETKGEAVLILGDMGELGEEASELHYKLGVDAAKMGIKQLFTVGILSQETSNGYNSVISEVINEVINESIRDVSLETDENKSEAIHFFDKGELIQQVKNKLHKHSVVLVKGSRSMAMEEVVSGLISDSEISNEKTEGDQ